MKKTRLQFYILLFFAQILALLYDTVFQSLQRHAGAWYQGEIVLALRYIPLFVIGILLSISGYLGRNLKGYGVILFILFNLLLLVYHYYVFLFREFIGMSLVVGYYIGVIIIKLVRDIHIKACKETI